MPCADNCAMMFVIESSTAEVNKFNICSLYTSHLFPLQKKGGPVKNVPQGGSKIDTHHPHFLTELKKIFKGPKEAF